MNPVTDHSRPSRTRTKPSGPSGHIDSVSVLMLQGAPTARVVDDIEVVGDFIGRRLCAPWIGDDKSAFPVHLGRECRFVNYGGRRFGLNMRLQDRHSKFCDGVTAMAVIGEGLYAAIINVNLVEEAQLGLVHGDS